MVTAFTGVLVGQQKIELDLRVIDGISADDLVEVVPFPHDLLVAGQLRGHCLLKKSAKRLH